MKKILISGAGIAGPTLAYWLLEYGFTPVLVEQAPQLRTGGYVIDFWGAGYDIAESMGLLPELQQKGYKVKEVRLVGDGGERVGGFSAAVFDRLTHGRYLSIPRGELAAAIYKKIEGKVETIFGDSVQEIRSKENEVEVLFESGKRATYDLLIGADGLHSPVREIVFGAQDQFEHYLGYKVAAMTVERYPKRDELVYLMYTKVAKQMARFSMRNNQTLFLLVFADAIGEKQEIHSLTEQKKLLREKFSALGWETKQILAEIEACDHLYFDRVSQIRMDHWSKNRVALIGDAAFCVSLLAGQGSALAMVAAYVLAGELFKAKGDHLCAFTQYEQTLRPLIEKKQQAAEKFAGAFAPKTAFGLFFRNQVMKLLTIPWIADWAIGQDLRDAISLPKYR